jgi:hypothetical protein
MGNYSEELVIKALSYNSDVRVNRVGKSIEINKGVSSLGNKTWGKIDYLTKYCGYTRCIVDPSNKSNKKSKKK